MTEPVESTYVSNAQIEVPFSTLIEEALSYLYRTEERPLPVQVGSVDMPLPSDDEFSVVEAASPEVNRTDLLEYGQELLFVTKRVETGPDPILTVIRAYGGSPNEGAILNQEYLFKGPRWKRFHVARAIIRGLSGSIFRYLPMTIETTIMVTGTEGGSWVALPDDTLDVIRVGWDPDYLSGPQWFDDWKYERDFSASPTLQALRLPTVMASPLVVRRKIPYTWRDPANSMFVGHPPWGQDGERYLVRLWAGTEDLIALYAAAYVVTGREVSRVEVESMEQWSADNAQRYQINLRLVQMLWTQFYERMNESRPLHRFETNRPFRRRKTISVGWS